MVNRLTAFADESIRVAATPPMYLIAATIIPDGASMTKLEALLPKGANKLHWRDLGRKSQKESLSRIADIESRSTIVVASSIDPRRQERARRKVLEVLLPLLESEGVTRLVMESRFPAADAKDSAHFRTMRKRGFVSTIELVFANPRHEHKLWIPDQILGAYGEHVTADGSPLLWDTEWSVLRERITVVDVPM